MTQRPPPASRYQDSSRSEVLEFIPPGARRLLDVGCWRGAFGAAVKRAHPDCRVTGIELDHESASIAQSRLDRVWRGEYPADVPLGERFDVVTFLDVLEHLVDPWAALSAAWELLEPGGVVIAVIPNVRHLAVTARLVLRGRWDYQDSGLLDRTHLRFFTKQTMLKLFRECSYEVRQIQALNLSGGKTGLLLRPGGRLVEQFRALQYVVVAYPTSRSTMARP